MAYQIDYAYTSHVGRVRAKNEDNFWCCGKTLKSGKNGTDGISFGSISQARLPLLAVFDGMGGENCGEIAAKLASEACGAYYQKNRETGNQEPETFFREICSTMNHQVCRYSEENRVGSMGTTAALLLFGAQATFACNLGDSRIYQVQDGMFRQISVDHVLDGGFYGKAPLTQYLGIPEEGMLLEPYVTRLDYTLGTRYLICSDGVTDMLSDEEIGSILALEIPVDETAELLLERALEKGGKDNVTIVVCQVGEVRKSLLRSWLAL
ncbi:MAG: serine/threonine-protein phosphatase [Blautia sp.]|nr:serine/threonine-protein phosphatase [Blautia sp.]